MTEPVTPEPVTPVPPTPEPPTTERPWWKRPWGIAGIVVGVLLALGVIGPLDQPPTRRIDERGPVGIDRRRCEPRLDGIARSVRERGATAEPTVEPTVEATAEPSTVPTAPPAGPVLEKTSGRGDKIVKFTAQEAPTVARITGRAAATSASSPTSAPSTTTCWST